MEERIVKDAIESFNEFLQKPDGYQCNQTIKISSVRSRESIQKRTFDNVLNAYQIIHNKLQSPDNLYTSLNLKPVAEVNSKIF